MTSEGVAGRPAPLRSANRPTTHRDQSTPTTLTRRPLFKLSLLRQELEPARKPQAGQGVLSMSPKLGCSLARNARTPSRKSELP